MADLNNVKKESLAHMEKNINNVSIYNDLANPYFLFLFIFQIDISNTIISFSKDENEFSTLIGEMEEDADYENDEKWGDYFSFIDDKISNSDNIAYDTSN